MGEKAATPSFEIIIPPVPSCPKPGADCGACTASCQSACKTSCTVGNQACPAIEPQSSRTPGGAA